MYGKSSTLGRSGSSLCNVKSPVGLFVRAPEESPPRENASPSLPCPSPSPPRRRSRAHRAHFPPAPPRRLSCKSRRTGKSAQGRGSPLLEIAGTGQLEGPPPSSEHWIRLCEGGQGRENATLPGRAAPISWLPTGFRVQKLHAAKGDEDHFLVVELAWAAFSRESSSLQEIRGRKRKAKDTSKNQGCWQGSGPRRRSATRIRSAISTEDPALYNGFSPQPGAPKSSTRLRME